MLLAPITMNERSAEDIQMAHLFKTALQARAKRRHTLANVINLPLPKVRKPVVVSLEHNALFEPMVNAFAA